MKSSFILIIVPLVLAGILGGPIAGQLISGPSPEESTEGSLLETINRIQNYVAEHHRLPAKLSDLPIRPGYGNELVDGWGQPLIYSPEPDGSVLLRSEGEAGRNNQRTFRFSIVNLGDDKEFLRMAETRENMEVIEDEIRKYSAAHHQLPKSYVDLPDVGTFKLNEDGWGRPISYTSQPDGTVLLSSQDKDGKKVFSLEFVVSEVKAARPTTSVKRPATAPTKEERPDRSANR